MALHNPLDDEDDRGDEILSLFQETCLVIPEGENWDPAEAQVLPLGQVI